MIQMKSSGSHDECSMNGYYLNQAYIHQFYTLTTTCTYFPERIDSLRVLAKKSGQEGMPDQNPFRFEFVVYPPPSNDTHRLWKHQQLLECHHFHRSRHQCRSQRFETVSFPGCILLEGDIIKANLPLGAFEVIGQNTTVTITVPGLSSHGASHGVEETFPASSKVAPITVNNLTSQYGARKQRGVDQGGSPASAVNILADRRLPQASER